MENLIELITQWGCDRKIIINGTLSAQWKKIISELGELADNLAKGKDISDDIGDIFVVACMMAGINNVDMHKAARVATPYASNVDDALSGLMLTIGRTRFKGLCDEETLTTLVSDLMGMCAIHNINFKDCVELAYNTIKDRKGTLTADGVFIKEC